MVRPDAPYDTQTIMNWETYSLTGHFSLTNNTQSAPYGLVVEGTVQSVQQPSVTVSVSPASVTENDATNLAYTFTRSGSTTIALPVNFNVGGTATFSTDYAQSGAATFSNTAGTVTIAAGSSTATVTIDPTADSTVELNETAVLTVAAGTGYTVGSPSKRDGDDHQRRHCEHHDQRREFGRGVAQRDDGLYVHGEFEQPGGVERDGGLRHCEQHGDHGGQRLYRGQRDADVYGRWRFQR